jgi:hypothetical protein
MTLCQVRRAHMTVLRREDVHSKSKVASPTPSRRLTTNSRPTGGGATYVTMQCFLRQQHNALDLRRKRADFQHSRDRASGRRYSFFK